MMILNHDVQKGSRGRDAHPVDGCLDVLQLCAGRPHEVGEGLSQGHPSHGSRVYQAHEGPLADGCGCSCQAKVALGSHGHIGHRQLQGPAALLLRHQPCIAHLLTSITFLSFHLSFHRSRKHV